LILPKHPTAAAPRKAIAEVNTIESAIRHITCLEGCLRETSCKIEELEEAEFKEAIVP
jgi:hypothetical protein